MKILFVSSGNSGKMSPIVKAQALSIVNHQCDVDYFLISEPGIKGYFKSIFELRKLLKQNEYDVFHAHYSLSGFVVSLAGAKKVVVSLMGDDVLTSRLLFVTRLLANYRWKKAIVKSREMKERLDSSNVEIIPNGVDLNTFKPMGKRQCQKKLGFSLGKINLLFAANPKRIVKNFKLFKHACDGLVMNGHSIEIHYLDNIPHQEIPIYMNAADIVCLSSLSEGSPNVIKEAMACNRPIVSTDVGDVKWLIDSLEGCYISSLNENEYTINLENALKFSVESKKTSGRERLKELDLDSESIAKKLLKIYQNEIV